MILGRTKGVQEDGHKFTIPCVKVTQGTHFLRPGVWFEQLLKVKEELGQRNGKLFRRNLWEAKLCEFEDDFYQAIERIQDTTDLSGWFEFRVRNNFGLSQTILRSLIIHTWNMQLSLDLQNAILW